MLSEVAILGDDEDLTVRRERRCWVSLERKRHLFALIKSETVVVKRRHAAILAKRALDGHISRGGVPSRAPKAWLTGIDFDPSDTGHFRGFGDDVAGGVGGLFGTTALGGTGAGG